MSTTLQWLLKLTATLFAAVIPLAFTILIGKLTFGDSFTRALDETFEHHVFLWLSAVVAFAAFWCACVVQGTVRAALWLFPALGAVMSAIQVSAFVGGRLVKGEILAPVVLRLHPFPFTDPTASLIFRLTSGRFAYLWLIVPPLAFAFFQTYRLFRREVDGFVPVIRYLLPVIGVTIVFSLGFWIPIAVAMTAGRQIPNTLKETHEAVGKLPLTLNAERPQQIAFEDLARTSQLSPAARRLLDNATIRVLPKSGDPRWFERYHIRSEYFTSIHFSNNWDCTAYGGGFFSCTTPTGPWGFPMTHP